MSEYRDTILTNFAALESSPIAIQALWDGDTTGWYIWLSAITADGERHQLGVISEGGDIRLFNGQVPPWPEATIARQMGAELTEMCGAEFYFPSPDHPEDHCPDWADRDKGYPCRRCGIPLLQRADLPWRGICSHCHLAELREQREAQWTEEERAGPRCFICGAPAKTEFDGHPSCISCAEKYEVYTCERCGFKSRVLKSDKHTSLCNSCEIRKSVEALTQEQRTIILAAFEQDEYRGIDVTVQLMGCSWHDANYVRRLLTNRGLSENSL